MDGSILKLKIDKDTIGKYKCSGSNEVGSLERLITINYYGKDSVYSYMVQYIGEVNPIRIVFTVKNF